LFLSVAKEFADIRSFNASETSSSPSGPSEAFGFKSFMHFSYYLMLAALALVGLEVVHALYQLAAFVL